MDPRKRCGFSVITVTFGSQLRSDSTQITYTLEINCSHKPKNVMELLLLLLQMTVTWTSGYDITEAVPFVEWGEKGRRRFLAPAGTLTFDKNSMCGK